jgi:hypothetical protein
MANFEIEAFKGPFGGVVSASMFLYTQVEDLRNSPKDAGIFEKMGRRIIGELAYAGVLVAAVVEVVFRAALALILIIPALPLLCLLAEGSLCTTLAAFSILIGWYSGVSGTVVSAETGVLALASLVNNLYQEEMNCQETYDQIIPACISEISEALMNTESSEG